MESTEGEGNRTERHPYEKPELREYGRLADLTRATNPVGAMGDGGMAGLTKSN